MGFVRALRYDTGVPSHDAPLDLLIIGAGLSGIGMAAHLVRQLPEKRFAILERRARMGGTWDLFRYPGVRSDSDMYTLGYAFAPWAGDRSVATGAEILGYLEDVARDHGLTDAIHCNCSVRSADWDSTSGLWTVHADTPDGLAEYRTRFLFAGAGYYDYDTPHDPALPGLERFGGDVLHPQFWPQDFEATGRRIAVIGSGATATTLVPALTRAGAQVTMIQRTPSWYYAEPGRDRLALGLRRLLPLQWAYRLIRWRNNLLQYAFYRHSRRKPQDVADYLLKRVRKDMGPAYKARDFTPPYGPWQQRLCFVPDGDLFAVIREGKARMVTGLIDSVTESGIRMADGESVEADTLVTATGLKLATLGNMAVSMDGAPVDFSEHWYYRNCMFSNVPNFAALFGYLNSAWTARVDSVAKWLCRLFAQMDAWETDVVTPYLPDDHALTEADPLAGFSSGYLDRGRGLIPKSAAQGPWRLSHDWLGDRKALRETPIDDGNLRFQRIARREALAPDAQLS